MAPGGTEAELLVKERREREDPARGCLIVEWALALPLTTAFAGLYIGPCESQALIQQRDNGIPIMVFRLLPRGVEWARGKALRLLEF